MKNKLLLFASGIFFVILLLNLVTSLNISIDNSSNLTYNYNGNIGGIQSANTTFYASSGEFLIVALHQRYNSGYDPGGYSVTFNGNPMTLLAAENNATYLEETVWGYNVTTTGVGEINSTWNTNQIASMTLGEISFSNVKGIGYINQTSYNSSAYNNLTIQNTTANDLLVDFMDSPTHGQVAWTTNISGYQTYIYNSGYMDDGIHGSESGSTSYTNTSNFMNWTIPTGADYSSHIALDLIPNNNSSPTITINLNSPVTNYNSSVDYITTNASVVTEANAITNVSVFTNITGSWIINQTNTSTYNNTNYIFNITGIPDGFYNWGYEACDNSGYCNFSFNKTLLIDTNTPNIFFILGGTNSSNNFSNSQTQFLVANSTSGTYSLSNITYNIFFANNTLFNTTTLNISGSGMNQTNLTINNLIESNYTIEATACQGNGNGTNCTTSSNFTMDIDLTPPAISLPSYINLTNERNTIMLALNISVVDSNSGTIGTSCIINLNGTNQTIPFSFGWCNTTSGNLTGLANGNHQILVYANDTLNNLGLDDSFYVFIINSLDLTSFANITNDTTNNKLDATLPRNITLNSDDSNNVTVNLPRGITIMGNSSWNGTIELPNIITDPAINLPSVPGYSTSFSKVIEVGIPNLNLTFDQPVEIIIPGETGKSVGYSYDGINLVPIATCTTSINETNLPTDGSCYYDDGTSIIIWTKHFTQFVTYTETAISYSPSNPNSGGGGGYWYPTQTTATPSNNNTNNTLENLSVVPATNNTVANQTAINKTQSSNGITGLAVFGNLTSPTSLSITGSVVILGLLTLFIFKKRKRK